MVMVMHGGRCRPEHGAVGAAVRCAALLLAVGGILGGLYGARAARAQAFYYTAKFGAAREDVARIVQLSEAAFRLYPRNYYFAMWTAERAYYTWEAQPEDWLLDAARHWCAIGLSLNDYKSSLRLLHTRLLRLESIAEATAYWEAFVAWNFWNPYHHAVVAELYAAGGRWGAAAQALRWARGSAHYRPARERVNALWRERMTEAPAERTAP